MIGKQRTAVVELRYGTVNVPVRNCTLHRCRWACAVRACSAANSPCSRAAASLAYRGQAGPGQQQERCLQPEHAARRGGSLTTGQLVRGPVRVSPFPRI